MTTRPDELAEARAIVRALERRELRNNGDKRFLESWRGYLARSGDDAQLGRWLMAMLRRVAQIYGLSQADEAEPKAQAVDLLI